MDRRSFLVGTGTLALSQALSACNTQAQETLKVQLLKGSIPNQVVKKFRSAVKQPAQIDFRAIEQLRNIFHQLQSWQQQKPKTTDDWRSRLPIPGLQSQQSAQLPDLVTLGDYWLAAAIEQKLIQPLDPSKLSQWSDLPPQWQKLVRRNDRGQLDPDGKVWAAPYRWGRTIIAYNREKFDSLGLEKPKDWGDLWRNDLRDRISLLDHPREVIGLTLKQLDRSYNTENLSQVPDLEQQLRRLDQQVKLYSSSTYLQPLILGDTWVAVGWSTDVLPAMQRYRQIDAVIPQSGTALWADLWVRPAGLAANRSLDQQWIDFCWQREIAEKISLLTKANSPIDTKISEGSEFLLPLSQETEQQYQSLWEEIRKV